MNKCYCIRKKAKSRRYNRTLTAKLSTQIIWTDLLSRANRIRPPQLHVTYLTIRLALLHITPKCSVSYWPLIMSEILQTSHTLVSYVRWFSDRLMWSRSLGLACGLFLYHWFPCPQGAVLPLGFYLFQQEQVHCLVPEAPRKVNIDGGKNIFACYEFDLK